MQFCLFYHLGLAEFLMYEFIVLVALSFVIQDFIFIRDLCKCWSFVPFIYFPEHEIERFAHAEPILTLVNDRFRIHLLGSFKQLY